MFKYVKYINISNSVKCIHSDQGFERSEKFVVPKDGDVFELSTVFRMRIKITSVSFFKMWSNWFCCKPIGNLYELESWINIYKFISRFKHELFFFKQCMFLFIRKIANVRFLTTKKKNQQRRAKWSTVHAWFRSSQ